MTKKIFFPLIYTITICCPILCVAEEENALLTFNMENQAELPPNFRMCTEILVKALETNEWTLSLANLNASASGQFSEKSLDAILMMIPNDDVIIVDLREESHGFINGIAVSWRGHNDWNNVGKTVEEVERDQKTKLKEVLDHRYALLHEKDHPRAVYGFYISQIATEEELVQSKGAQYIHMPVTNHVRPSDRIVDAFIAFANALPENKWLHFHCSAGKGRSTTFFAMYDMLRNAQKITLDDVFERQQLIGGKDFTIPPDPTTWKYTLAIERIEFLKKFYQYCCEADTKNVSWSQWSNSL